jgi:predicted small lipoprotein YifL
MKTFHQISFGLILLASLSLTACGNGGSLTLEPGRGPASQLSQGSPFVSVNQGGKAMIVQQGMTPTTGVHGWLTIQAVSSKNLNGADGSAMVLNRSQAFH